LGHILAHEIGHVLENVARHSDTGLMQANWTRDDISMMIWAGLPFAPEDKALIRARMEFVNRPATAVVAVMAEGSTR
jgi:predicted metalloendopeptidase